MIVCRKCDQHNPDGAAFCGNCGAFLEWDGEPAAEQVAQPMPPTAELTPRSAEQAAQLTPEPVRPDAVASRPHVVVAGEPASPAPDDRICTHCGAGNKASQRFCRSCGRPLAEPAPPPPVRRSWWRSLIAWVTRRRVYAAGARRPVAAPVRWRRPVLFLAVLLTLALLLMLPNQGLIAQITTAVQDRISPHVPVTPVAARASSSAADTRPERLTDGASNRYWAPAGPAVGAWVEVDFAQPVRLLDVVVTAGASTDKQRFLAEGRPHELDVVVTTTSGHHSSAAITLRDEPGAQRFTLKVSDAARVRFTIRSTYGLPPGHVCAIAELEFFARG
jgi:hypothetical protein